MKTAIWLLSALCLATPAQGQQQGVTWRFVAPGDRHSDVHAEIQARIKAQHGEGIAPHFFGWYRLHSSTIAEVFPQLSFYFLQWEQRKDPASTVDVRGAGLSFNIRSLYAIHTVVGTIAGNPENDEGFGDLLRSNDVVLSSDADARRIVEAFCHIHQYSYFQSKRASNSFKKVSDTVWHLGITHRDRTVAQAEESATVVTETRYKEVTVDADSKRIVSWTSKLEESEPHTVLKTPKP